MARSTISMPASKFTRLWKRAKPIPLRVACVISAQFFNAVSETQKLRIVAGKVGWPAVSSSPHQTCGSAAVGGRKSRVKRYCIPEMLKGGVIILRARGPVDMRKSTIELGNRIDVATRSSACSRYLSTVELRFDGSHDLLRYSVLQIENIVQRAVKSIRPQMGTCRGVDKREMSRSLLNIAERPLPRLTLRGVGLTSKDAVS